MYTSILLDRIFKLENRIRRPYTKNFNLPTVVTTSSTSTSSTDHRKIHDLLLIISSKES